MQTAWCSGWLSEELSDSAFSVSGETPRHRWASEKIPVNTNDSKPQGAEEESTNGTLLEAGPEREVRQGRGGSDAPTAPLKHFPELQPP